MYNEEKHMHEISSSNRVLVVSPWVFGHSGSTMDCGAICFSTVPYRLSWPLAPVLWVQRRLLSVGGGVTTHGPPGYELCVVSGYVRVMPASRTRCSVAEG